MKYYIADTHFDHKNVISLCGRPFTSLKFMQEEMIGKWNAKVHPSDDVYVIGDFCFESTNFVEYAHALSGNIHFIPGNHDFKSFKHARELLKKYKRFSFHDQIHIIKDYNLSNEEMHIILCHYPLKEWPHFYKNSLHIHGHTHGTIGRSFCDRAFDVGVDLHDFSPVTLHELLELNND